MVEVNRLADLVLCLLQVIGQGAVPVVDPDQQYAVVHLVRDGAFAGLLPDMGNLGKRDLRPAGGGQHQIPKCLGTVAGILGEPHGNVIRPVGHIDRADRGAADPGLDQVGDVGYVDAVAGSRLPVDVDGDLRDRGFLEYGRIRRALDAVQHVDDLSADAAQFLEIIADNADDQRAVRTTDRIVDHIDDRLADADGEPRQLLQAGIELAQELRLGLALGPGIVGFQADRGFDVGRGPGIGSVIGTAELGDGIGYLGEFA